MKKPRIQKGGSIQMGQPADSDSYGLVSMASLPLFPEFPSFANVRQGYFANCYVESCTLGVLAKYQRLLGFMVRAVSGGAEQTFYQPAYASRNGKMELVALNAVTLGVDAMMPTAGNWFGARPGTCSYANYLEKLWVAWFGFAMGSYSWASAERGYPSSVLTAWGFDVHYLGRGFTELSIQTIAAKPGEIVIMTTNADVMGGHCLCVKEIDLRNRVAIILNPWGSDGVFVDNQDDGTIYVPLSALDGITNNVVMTNGVIWPVPIGASPTDPKRVALPPRVSPLQP